jgi:SulP family sulfate permease
MPKNTSNASPRGAWWHLYVPKSVTVLRQGYGLSSFRDDAVAGLTVAIVALPLAMALAIASGTTPANGLITVVVAGFVISLLSGCRYQVGGPAGAFVVIVFNIIAAHGYDGLVLATLMAGVMLLAAGAARLGDWIKYIPQPVVTGFTAGIALIIFSSQIRDLFGLSLDSVPGDFLGKWAAFWDARDTVNPYAVITALMTLSLIIVMRRFVPRLPAFLVAIVTASVMTWGMGIDVATIGSVFGGIPSTLPAPHLPEITLERMQALLPSAFTIAFLAGIESLLCAVVADGMSGRRHKSNCELVAQGAANFISALFGGMPATGTIARTATNIRAGAKSPVSGILHAVFVLLFMVSFAPLASYIPLAALGAVLVIVAWNMSEREKFMTLLRGPRGDGFVLIVTFLLTVLVDLTVAIEAGVVMAAILFMHRMSQAVEMQTGVSLISSDVDDFGLLTGDGTKNMRAALPAGVESFQIHGPLFFGVAGRLLDVLEQVVPPPRVFILRMSRVPLIDASGAAMLEEFIRRCRRQGTQVILSTLQQQPAEVLRDMKVAERTGDVLFSATFAEAIEQAKEISGTPQSTF